MNKSLPLEGQEVELVQAGAEGSSPQPVPQFQREPNRAERRRMQHRKPMGWQLSKDGKIPYAKDLNKGAFGSKKKQWVTKISADPHKWVEPAPLKAPKKPRAKKIVPAAE